MRTSTLLCGLSMLMLVSCNQVAKTPKPAPSDVNIFGSGDDSSPIIIADGSIHIKHTKNSKLDHFRVHAPTHASVKQGSYQPYYLGFGCTANWNDKGNCTSDCTPGNATAPCRVAIGPSDAMNWTLSLCENPSCTDASATVQVKWQVGDPTDAEKLDITSLDSQKFEVNPPSGNDGTDLHHISNNHLQTAILSGMKINSTALGPFNFTCQPNLPCLTVTYDCHVSGNALCGK